ncbi:ABC transporter permease [Breznakiella homolactica]|uniref:ABC transporter permease n=2 Tax=Breznakiella homolactica TaxID=2798577 RepID=A0A7T7XS27_9SPIR|nr:ABC transporter permease [Breznakiella homolactica]
MLIVAYPILSSIIRSLTDRQTKGFTFDNYTYFFTRPLEIRNILFTLGVVVVTVVLAMVFAYLLALYLRFSKSKISRLIGGLYLIPRFIPGLVAIYAMMIIIRDSGVINRISQLFGYNFKPGLMYNEKGLIIMNLWFNIPFAALIITSGLSAIPDSIIEGARDVGAGRWRTFIHMILPLSIKDVFVSATFVFMANVGSFTTPFLIMGASSPKMLGIALFEQFNIYMDYEKTSALSVIMFLICSVSAAVYIYTNLKEKEWEK